jgi:hypothetical protein
MSPPFSHADPPARRPAADRRPGRAAAPLGEDEVMAPKPRAAHAFRAELDIAELDSRGRPGPAWSGRAVELSRSHLAFRSRRMCYEGRELLIAVHLIDDRPTPLFGAVSKSDYDGDGLYRTVIDLQHPPENDAVAAWINTLAPRHRE